MTFDQKTYIRQYYQENKESIRERARAYYRANAKKIKARVSARKEQNKDKVALYRRRRRFRVLKEIFDALGFQCSLCPETDPHVLQIDHVNGGGRQHAIRTKWSMQKYYGAILEAVRAGHGEYRILCANCNIREGIRKGFRTSIWDFAESFFKDL